MKLKNTVLLIVQQPDDVVPALIVSNSIVQKCSCKLTLKVLFTFLPSWQVRSEFDRLSNDHIIVLVDEIKDDLKPNSTLSVLFGALRNCNDDEHILYILNSCLALSDFSDLFAYPKNKILCSKTDQSTSALDTNLILFNPKLFKKQFVDFASDKEINVKTWHKMMLDYYEEIPSETLLFAKDYKNISLQTLQNVKFICFHLLKPWQCLSVPFGFLWWQYARQSIFYETTLLKNLLNTNQIEVDSKTLIENDPDLVYSLVKLYIKEAFLYLFTFGEKAKTHKINLSLITQKISMEIKK